MKDGNVGAYHIRGPSLERHTWLENVRGSARFFHLVDVIAGRYPSTFESRTGGINEEEFNSSLENGTRCLIYRFRRFDSALSHCSFTLNFTTLLISA
jgi:hypothetical protein